MAFSSYSSAPRVWDMRVRTPIFVHRPHLRRPPVCPKLWGVRLLSHSRAVAPPPSVVTMNTVPALIDTAVAQAAIRLSQSTESPAVFNHSVRSYLFGELR